MLGKKGLGPTSSGLTAKEQAVMFHLIRAWEAFIELPERREGESLEFQEAIQTAQRLLAMRIVSRDYPGYWRVWPEGVPAEFREGDKTDG